MLKMRLAPVVLVATSAFASPSFAASPTNNYPAIVRSCGANPILIPGSSPFSGAIIPDPSVTSCQVEYKPLSPFPTVIDGSTGDHVAPVCNVQLAGPHVVWSFEATAAAIRVEWDWTLKTPLPVSLITWQCSYPWTPSNSGSPGIGSKAQ